MLASFSSSVGTSPRPNKAAAVLKGCLIEALGFLAILIIVGSIVAAVIAQPTGPVPMASNLEIPLTANLEASFPPNNLLPVFKRPVPLSKIKPALDELPSTLVTSPVALPPSLKMFETFPDKVATDSSFPPTLEPNLLFLSLEKSLLLINLSLRALGLILPVIPLIFSAVSGFTFSTTSVISSTLSKVSSYLLIGSSIFSLIPSVIIEETDEDLSFDSVTEIPSISTLDVLSEGLVGVSLFK